MNYLEQKIQTAIVVALRRRFDCFVYAVPNGGARTRLEALAFRDAGLTAGVPDLEVIGTGGASFYIEVKDAVQVRERNVPSDRRFYSLSVNQQKVVPELRRRGRVVHVVDSVEDAIAAGEAFGLAPRRAAPTSRTPEAVATGF